MPISKAELMLRGARSRLVEINRERLELVKLFPELEAAIPVPEIIEPPVGASGRRLVKGGTTHKVWQWMVTHGNSTTVQAVADALHIPPKTAYTSLNQLVQQKLATKIGRTGYRLIRK